MLRLSLLVLFALTLASCRDGEHEAFSADSHPLSMRCAACHAKEYQDWQGSHHAHAWKPVATTPDGRIFKRVDGTPLPVTAAIGHSPLVQYLVQGERGAFQCTAAAWDVTRREWFDTVADDARLQQEGTTERKQGDWGHWLGRGMTWNSQCAACHVTGFEKHYNAAADSYASRWQEPGVTCIQCHSLADTPTLPNGRPVRRNKDKKLTASQIADSCATCHARREELRPGFREGDLFEDYYRLELPLVEGVFYPNGLQRDEVYTETSMRLSPMGKAGVTCLDCHDAHSARLRLPQENNALCLRCHGTGAEVNGTKAPVIAPEEHSPCPPKSKGGSCVECHMPESVFMARDARRDHSFSSPDPALSTELGIPNACTHCHTGKDNTWAAAELERFYGRSAKREHTRARARAIAAAMRGEGDRTALLAAYRAETNPTWRATLLELLARQEPHADIRREAQRAAADATPLLRAAAARILGTEAPQLLSDPVRVVRHAAAWAQLDSLLAAESPHPVLAELAETLQHQADHPAGAMQAALLAAGRARHARSPEEAATHAAEAERQYRRALALDPASAAVRMDFALYLAQQARPLEALEQMLVCTAAHPNHAEAQYRLALLLHELGHPQPARRALQKALQLSPHHARARRALQELQPSMTP